MASDPEETSGDEVLSEEELAAALDALDKIYYEDDEDEYP